MKKIILLSVVCAFTVISSISSARSHGRTRPARNPEDILDVGAIVSRAEAERYASLLAQVGNYSTYCDKALTGVDHAIQKAYATKHNAWADLDEKSAQAFGGIDTFDRFNTSEFNKTSLAFIQRRQANYGGDNNRICNAEREQFSTLTEMNVTELLNHIRELVRLSAAPAVREASPPPAAPAVEDPEEISVE